MISYRIENQQNIYPFQTGFIWIGQAGQNPVARPVTIYYDENNLYPKAQPVLIRNNMVEPFYGPPEYSILIKNSAGQIIHSNLNAAGNLIEPPIFLNPNAMINGDFIVGNVLKWQQDGAATSWKQFDVGQSEVPGNPSSYVTVTKAGGNNRIYSPIESVYTFSGQTVTLSFWARIYTGYQFEVSLTQYFGAADSDVPDIGKHTVSLTPSWTKYEFQIDIPSIAGKNVYPYPLLPGAYEHHALVLVITLIDGGIDIADIKLEAGHTATPFNRIEILSDDPGRYIESPQTIQTFIASGISTVIPGFQFASVKRGIPATVEIYSPISGNNDYIYHVGVGDIEVTSIDDITNNGVGTLTLAAPTTAGGIYGYIYHVKDDVTL